eukprot:UC1_evm2s1845
MFFLMTLQHDVLLHPRLFNQAFEDEVKKALYENVEGKCVGKHGFIVSVVNVKSIGDGMILQTRGEVLFHVAYEAIVMRPFKNEVCDAIVKTVFKFGIWANVGPLNVFISQAWIPHKFDGTTSRFVTEDESEQIQVGDAIRIRIIGTKVFASEIRATASLEGDYLGLLE